VPEVGPDNRVPEVGPDDRVPEVGSDDGSVRQTSAVRREQVLVAARTVIARDGLNATTEAVARAAGVSQPYVMRLFGTKRDLVVAAYAAAAERVVATFEAVEPGPEAAHRLSDAYLHLLEDRDQILVLLQGFVAGADPQVGQIARHTLARVFRLYVERTGEPAEGGRNFVAAGMLLTVLTAVQAAEHRGEQPDLDTMIDTLDTPGCGW